MRTFFPKGKQKDFINKILNKVSVKEAAVLCNLSERTIRDWRREKFSVDLDSLRKLCKKTKIKIPSSIKLKDDYWYIAHSSILGAKAVIEKYGSIGGDPEYRKKKWREWWEVKGKYNNPLISCKSIKIPRKSNNLAEFVGIVLGDGQISKNQINITLNLKDDKDYGEFVARLIKDLFHVPVKKYIYKNYSVARFYIFRTNLVNFCVQKLGLKSGNKVKQQVDVPDWIKKNDKYARACARGLIDTDGSVFNHRYKVGGKYYNYKKLCFTNYSKPLVRFVFNVFKQNGLKSRLSRNVEVWIDSQENMAKYCKIFGFHNTKHLKRYMD